MKRYRYLTPIIEELNCLGDYTTTNPLCAKYCVLRLRCAIEQEQNIRMEMLEDLAGFEKAIVTIQ